MSDDGLEAYLKGVKVGNVTGTPRTRLNASEKWALKIQHAAIHNPSKLKLRKVHACSLRDNCDKTSVVVTYLNRLHGLKWLDEIDYSNTMRCVKWKGIYYVEFDDKIQSIHVDSDLK